MKSKQQQHEVSFNRKAAIVELHEVSINENPQESLNASLLILTHSTLFFSVLDVVSYGYAGWRCI
jgi:hypothetical protein